MPEQLVLPGFEPEPEPRPAAGLARPKETHALFFALFPDPGTAALIAERADGLRAAHGLRGTPLKAQRLHVTLQYLGQWLKLAQETVDAAKAAAAVIAMPPFEVVLDEALTFDQNPRCPLVLRSSDGAPCVTALQGQLHAALLDAGFRSLVGHPAHMTLAYRSAHLPEQTLAPIRWQAHEFVLVHSYVGKGVHEALSRWSLRA